MANEFKVKHGLIVNGSGSTVLDVQGSQGQLFSITDSLSGSLFSVGDISGIPILEVFSDDTVKIGSYNNEAIVVSGSHATVSGSFSGSFVGDGSGLTGVSVTAPTLQQVTDQGATTTNDIGIGTASPLSILDIRPPAVTGVSLPTFGTSAYAGLHIVPSGSDTTEGWFGLTFGNTASSTGERNRTTAGIFTSALGSYGNKLYFATSNSWSTGAVSRMVIDHDGNVGIGTTSPGVKLHVTSSGEVIRLQGASGQSYMTFFQGTGGRVGYIGTAGANDIVLESADDLNLYSGGSSTMYLDTSGNVGIGITSPSQLLDVAGNINLDGDNRHIYFGGSNTFIGERSNSTHLELRGGGSAGAQTIYINSSGNLGLGTAFPIAKLDVRGDASISSSLTVTGSLTANGLAYPTSDGSVGQVIVTDGNGNLSFDTVSGGGGVGNIDGTGSADYLTKWVDFNTLTSSSIYEDSSGNIGIGTTAPTHELQVIGGANISERLIVSGAFTASFNSATDKFLHIRNEYVSESLLSGSVGIEFGYGTQPSGRILSKKVNDFTPGVFDADSELFIQQYFNSSFKDIVEVLQRGGIRVNTFTDNKSILYLERGSGNSSNTPVAFLSSNDGSSTDSYFTLNVLSDSTAYMDFDNVGKFIIRSAVGAGKALGDGLTKDHITILPSTDTVVIGDNLYTSGSITGSDIQIDDWGSVSASLASISASAASGGTTPTLQQVTEQGSSTDQQINITGALTASGLIYPTTDGQDHEVLVTDGSGKLSFDRPNVYATVRNVSGVSLSKGTPVHANGTTGNASNVIAASASVASTMPATYVLNEDLANGAEGVAIVTGFINGVNTSAFSEGDIVYVGAYGGYTNVKPTGSSYLIQNLGIVNKVDATNGSGFIYGSGRSNDVPNLPVGKVWVGSSTYSVTSSVVHLDETNGRLGIGTTSPKDSLHIQNGNILVEPSGSIVDAHNGLLIGYNRYDSSKAGYWGASDGKVLNSDGNLYFAPRNINPGNGSYIQLGQRDSNTASDKGTIKIQAGTYNTNSQTGDIFLNYGASQTMLLDGATGDVGIGTTSPAQKLHVAGYGMFYNDGASTDHALVEIHAKTDTGIGNHGRAAWINLRGSSVSAGTRSNYDWIVGANFTGNFEIARDSSMAGGFDSSSISINRSTLNVGIGTTSPSYKLDVSGSGNFTDGLTVTGSILHDGDLTVTGTVTAQEFHTEFVSSSIIFSSGSTKFGDSSNDNHNFTGSINLSGSIDLTGDILLDRTNEGKIAFGIAGDMYGFNAANNVYLQKPGSSGGFNFNTQGHSLQVFTGTSAEDVILQSGTTPGISVQATGGLRYTQHAATNNNSGYVLTYTNNHIAGNGERGKVEIAGDFTIEDYSSGTAVEVANIKNNGDAYFSGSVGIGTATPSGSFQVAGPSVLGTDFTTNATYTNKLRTPSIFSDGAGDSLSIASDGYAVQEGPAILIDGRSFTIGSYDNGEIDAGIKFTHTNNTQEKDIVQILANATAQITVSGSGNVGVGTETPDSQLEVAGDIHLSGNNTNRLDVDAGVRITGNYKGNNGTEYTYLQMYNGGNASINMGAKHPLGYISFEAGSGAYTERMRINNSGNVGIGTTAPTVPLQVVGNISGSGYVQATSYNVVSGAYNIGVDSTYLRFYSNGAGWKFTSWDGGYVDRILIKKTGEVGIGVSNPTYELEVSGSVSASAFYGDGSNLTGISAQSRIPKVEYLSLTASIATNDIETLPNSLTYTTASNGYEYLEVFVDGIRLNRTYEYSEYSTSQVRYLFNIPSGSVLTYKSLTLV